MEYRITQAHMALEICTRTLFLVGQLNSNKAPKAAYSLAEQIGLECVPVKIGEQDQLHEIYVEFSPQVKGFFRIDYSNGRLGKFDQVTKVGWKFGG